MQRPRTCPKASRPVLVVVDVVAVMVGPTAGEVYPYY